MVTDTIAAISTGMTESGIGIVRISGAEAFSIAKKIFHAKKKNFSVEKEKTHTIHYGAIFDGENFIDEVLLTLMKAPHTYTTEDVIEINCHGGVLVTRKVLETVLKYGARPAEPGEFTKRAFLNGRIDLSQAESVMDVIHSKNDFALKSAESQLRGSLKKKISSIREVLLHEIAYIEAALDDPEHYDVTGYGQILREKVLSQKEEIENLLAHADHGILLREGIQTAIVGKPNAGKSSLLNALLGKERAIVTEIAGTTRDVLQEQLNLGGLTLHIMDTAGIHHTEDTVEKIGVEKSKESIENADLVLFVLDSSKSMDENDREIFSFLSGKKYILIENKNDLPSEEKKEAFETDAPIVSISAKTGDGLAELEKTIKEMFFQGEISFNDEVYITNIRHKNALYQASESLSMVLRSIEEEMPEDFYTIDLLNAYTELGTIIGESLEEDVVNEIFQKFCMGK